MDRYNIALKKKVPKRYIKKTLRKLEQWWDAGQSKLYTLIQRLIRRFRRQTPEPRRFERVTGYSGITGVTGYSGSTGLQGLTGIIGYPPRQQYLGNVTGIDRS